MSLYLKYRPQNFSEVVGQEAITETLQNALKNGAVTHAYLFAGSRGTGKTSLARILAKAISCEKTENGVEPCNECELCKSIQAGHLVDLIEIDAASNRGIDEIRELREKIVFAPSRAKAKIYIIDEVHMLSTPAFNALLKTLEEPPAHAYFILATTELHKIPETILSRCQHFSFKRIEIPAIVKRLEVIAKKEGIKAETAALELIAEAAHGGLRDAVGLMEQMILDGAVNTERVAKNLGLSGRVLMDSFLKALQKKEIGEAIKHLEKIHAEGQNLTQFCGEFIGFLRHHMLKELDEKKEIAEGLRLIEIFLDAKARINGSPIPQLPLEIAILKACDFEIKARKSEGKTEKESKEAPVAMSSGASADLEKIRSQWKQIVERIETPFIRTSFLDGEPIRLENDRLTMAFSSSSLMEKINSPTNQAMVIRAFESVLGNKITLKLELKKVNLQLPQEPGSAKAPSLAEMAREVFGG